MRCQCGLDAFGDAEMAVRRHGEQPDGGIGHRTQHLLPRRGLGTAVIKQEGPVDASGPFTRHDARQCNQPRPPTPRVEIRQVGVAQQVRASWIDKAARAQIGVAWTARQRQRSGNQSRNLMCRVTLGGRWCRRNGAFGCSGRDTGDLGRLGNQGAAIKPGCLLDGADRAATMIAVEIDPVPGTGPAQGDDA